MSDVIFTTHAKERIHERVTRITSESDLKTLAKIAWQNRYVKKSALAARLNRKLNRDTENVLKSEAGGFIFVFEKHRPILITMYTL